ncbi:MAG: PAS domain S-box protein [Bacteroidetes bacterium]|nr:PAS domain S-box protein [Bacteroidota bacterium]
MIQRILTPFTRSISKESFLRSFLIVLSFIVISRTFEYILLETFSEVPHGTIILINTVLVSVLMVPGLYLLVYRPIAQLLAEREMAEADAKMFEQTIRSINGVVNIADLNDNILFVNEAFCRTYQYTEQELIGRHSSLFWSDRNPKEVVAQILPATLNGGWKGELYNKRKDGTEFPIILTTSLIKDSNGNRVAVVGMVEDITERKRAELERQTIFEITQGVTATSNLRELLTVIHASLKKVVYAENCYVAVFDEQTKLLSFPYFVDRYDPWPPPGPMNRGCTAYVYRSGRPFLLTQQMFDELVEQGEVELIGTNAPSWLGVPLQTPAGTIGVLVVQHYEQQDVYTEHDVQFLHSVGSHIAMAIERKNAQEELQSSEEMFRRLFDESADPILLLDRDRFTRCNAATVALLGYGSEQEFLQKEPYELSPEYQPDGMLSSVKSVQMMEQAVRDGYHRFEWTHLKSDGSELFVEVMLTPVVLKGKQYLYTIWRDIGDRKRAEQALRESVEHFRAVTQSANEAIITTDAAGTVLNWNNGAVKIFGYTEQEILGRSLKAIIPEELLARHTEGMNRVVRSKERRLVGATVELTGRRKNGEIFPLEISIAEWEAASGTHFTGIIRDVTARKLIEADREQLIADLQNALEEVKTLSGIVPICANCKKIRDDKGYWEQVDHYVSKHTDAQFSHSICPDCTKELYPEQYQRIQNKKIS